MLSLSGGKRNSLPSFFMVRPAGRACPGIVANLERNNAGASGFGVSSRTIVWYDTLRRACSAFVERSKGDMPVRPYGFHDTVERQVSTEHTEYTEKSL